MYRNCYDGCPAYSFYKSPIGKRETLEMACASCTLEASPDEYAMYCAEWYRLIQGGAKLPDNSPHWIFHGIAHYESKRVRL